MRFKERPKSELRTNLFLAGCAGGGGGGRGEALRGERFVVRGHRSTSGGFVLVCE
jgi:hypothetical protein